MSTALTSADVFQVTQTVWLALVEKELAAETEDMQCAGHVLTGCVQVTGEWEGAIVVSCSHKLAVDTTAFMFDMASEEVTSEELQDAVGELANMVGGSIKGLVPGPSRLSLPTVIDGSNYHTKIPGSEKVVEAFMSSDGEPVVVTVMQRVGS